MKYESMYVHDHCQACKIWCMLIACVVYAWDLDTFGGPWYFQTQLSKVKKRYIIKKLLQEIYTEPLERVPFINPHHPGFHNLLFNTVLIIKRRNWLSKVRKAAATLCLPCIWSLLKNVFSCLDLCCIGLWTCQSFVFLFASVNTWFWMRKSSIYITLQELWLC